jgi:MSHA biogenesis protein MshJ
MIERARRELRRLMDRIDELSLRERGLIFVGILVVMYLGAVNLVFQPLAREQTRLETQLKSKRDQIQASERQIQALLTGESADGEPAKRARLAALREQLVALDAELAKSTAGLVTPKEMARLVEGFLASKRGLEVVKVESLAPAPLVGEGAGAPGAARPAAAPVPRAEAVIYKHGMRIELRGGYLEMLGYLRALEALPWRVFWGQASLTTEKHPVSRLTLVIYTLSTHEGWIAI